MKILASTKACPRPPDTPAFQGRRRPLALVFGFVSLFSDPQITEAALGETTARVSPQNHSQVCEVNGTGAECSAASGRHARLLPRCVRVLFGLYESGRLPGCPAQGVPVSLGAT